MALVKAMLHTRQRRVRRLSRSVSSRRTPWRCAAIVYQAAAESNVRASTTCRDTSERWVVGLALEAKRVVLDDRLQYARKRVAGL
jgi:hypothetical protein